MGNAKDNIAKFCTAASMMADVYGVVQSTVQPQNYSPVEQCSDYRSVTLENNYKSIYTGRKDPYSSQDK